MESAREHHIVANGLTHHVLEWGAEHASETVVLCHGFLDLAYGFAELAPRLAHKRRVLAIDFRGHGESGRVPPGGYYYFPDYVLDLHALLPQLVSAPFHLVGHSMGGTVCAYYAATHRTQLRSLALLEGLSVVGEDPSRAPARLTTWLEQMTAASQREVTQLRDLDDAFTRLSNRHPHVEETFLRALAARSTCPHPRGEGLSWRFDPLHRTRSPIAFDAKRFEHCLAQIEAPTLVLQGERGFNMPDDDMRIGLIRRAHKHTVAGAGHMLHWTHCEQVASLLSAHFA